MNAFNASFTEFCAGNGDLDTVIAALESDLQHDRRARTGYLSLIEFAWRTGKIDPDSYATLKEILDQGQAAPVASGPRSGRGADVQTRHVSGSFPDTKNDETRQRQSDRGAAKSGSVPQANSDETRARSQPRGGRGSQPSAGWVTSPSPVSNEDGTTLEPGTVVKERFVLEEVLGRGGMGTVFRAKDLRKEEAQDRFPYVAVKILNEDFRRHPDSLKALQREARKAQTLAHPNIVAVYDFDRDGELVFLVMELLEGISLERLIRDSSRRGLPPTEALRILRGLGAALAHAHQKGVVHCDFKPANAFRCGDGSIKVFDFGIARAIVHGNMRPNETRFDAGTLGALTPGYASSELELGAEPDPRDDVFALACVAYELLSGKHPFDRTSALQAERSDMKIEPIEGLDRRTWRGLQRGLAFARNDRTPSIERFIAELSPRRPLSVALAASAAAAGVAALGVGLWLSLSSSSDRPSQAVASQANQVPDSTVTAMPAVERTRPPVDAGSEVVATKPAPQQNKVPTVQRPAATTAAVQAPDAPSEPTDEASRKEAGVRAASAEVLKKQLMAYARSNSIMGALDALRDLEARLPPSDPFLVEEAPRLIGQAYQRLAEQALASGNFDAASSNYDRALERLGDDPTVRSGKEQAMRVTALARMLEVENNLSAEAIQQRLTEIRDAGDPKTFAVVNSRLADIFARRITRELEADPDVGTANLVTARAVFAGVPSIDSIKDNKLAAE